MPDHLIALTYAASGDTFYTDPAQITMVEPRSPDYGAARSAITIASGGQRICREYPHDIVAAIDTAMATRSTRCAS